MKQHWHLPLVLAFSLLVSIIEAGRIPWGSQAVPYTSGCKFPTNANNAAINAPYTRWNDHYFRVPCASNGGAFLMYDDQPNSFSPETGRGMIFAALKDNQTAFDLLYKGYETYQVRMHTHAHKQQTSAAFFCW